MSDPLVVLEEFSLAREGRTLVEGHRWVVESGQRVLLTGASGSGKSSFLLALAGLLDHAPGLEARGRWSAPRPGVVFQNPYSQLVSPGLDEELAFGLENAGWDRPAMVERVRELKRAFGLTALDGRAPWTFSGGEAQRVALAAALAPRPSLVVLDEPLGYLDPGSAQTLVNHATEDHRRTAWVVVDHDPRPWASWADVHYRLENGRWEQSPIPEVAGCGSPLGAVSGGPVLEVSRLTAGYGRGPAVLEDFDLVVHSGETVAVVGPSGAGKSTLFRALTGQVRPWSGTMRVHGREFRPRLNRPSPLSWVPQVPEHYFIHPTVSQEWGDQQDAARAWGLDALAERHPFTLSEGEKRRLNLVSALASNRDILLLDEPQFGLDPRSRRALEAALADLRAAGKTIVFISHEPEFCARNAHRVVEVAR